MQELIFATHNDNKAIEIQALLGENFRILTLDQVGFSEEVPEEQVTLEGNASQKSRYVYERLNRDCFADDTGLEVSALGGTPGVYSARFAEMSGDRMANEPVSEANIRKLLRQMENIHDRKARFRTVISLVINGEEHRFDGIVEGLILNEKKGEGGFGYDPVFQPEGCTQSFAEMSLADKNRISHRGRAVEKLVKFLKKYGSE